jgi:sRNA-binding regulator protein Hfq
VNFQIKNYINREIFRHKEEETVIYILYKHAISSILISLKVEERQIKMSDTNNEQTLTKLRSTQMVQYDVYNSL